MRPRATTMLLIAASILATSTLSSEPRTFAQQSTALPTPCMEGGIPLMSAIAKRQSIRAYSERSLSNDTLSDLLWAAFGINRGDAGERTAPSWRGSKEIDIYVAMPEAVFMYDPLAHALKHVMNGDIRATTGRQPFPATAPIVLIYVADRARMTEAPEQEQHLYAHVDAAFIAQNVYLFAASEGLGTVVLGNVEKAELANTMKLRSNQILTFTQPVGYPKIADP